MASRGSRTGTRRQPPFELTGGALCLDFTNTMARGAEEGSRDRCWSSYEDLVAWSREAGALESQQASRMLGRGRMRSAEATAALQHARSLREALFAVFSASAAGRAVPGEALEELNERLPMALSKLRLVKQRRGYSWSWRDASPALEAMLWPVVRSAAELLTSAELSRVRECAAERCAWLFLDKSKNQSRRWCDMAVCGNRDKARRHRESLREHRRKAKEL
jgi:predicted RNA-binding Zn ribbon-like protein